MSHTVSVHTADTSPVTKSRNSAVTVSVSLIGSSDSTNIFASFTSPSIAVASTVTVIG